jgi:hypothetical protein
VLASRIVWFDAYVANVDRTARNSNLLVWHRAIRLIDHGAALYFHHDRATAVAHSRDPFRHVKDHLLLSYASQAVELDEVRLRALDPGVDLELVRQHLQSFIVICRGGPEALAIGRLTPRQRFDWLVAPRSTIIQTSAVHSGRSDDPAATLEHVMRTMVRAPQP